MQAVKRLEAQYHKKCQEAGNLEDQLNQLNDLHELKAWLREGKGASTSSLELSSSLQPPPTLQAQLPAGLGPQEKHVQVYRHGVLHAPALDPPHHLLHGAGQVWTP